MLKPARITTVIPTYRRPEKLRRAIRSVLKQTYPHFRILVLDNASGDETATVVRELRQQDPRIEYVCHAQTIDVVQNFQAGLLSVQTEFFSFLADDDVLLPNFFKDTMAQLEAYPQAACCVGSAVEVDEATGAILRVPMNLWQDVPFATSNELLHDVICHGVNWCGTLFRTAICRQVEPLNQEFKTFDYEYMIRLATRHPFALSKSPAALFVHHVGSYSNMRHPKLIWPSWTQFFPLIDAATHLTLEEKRQAKEWIQRQIDRALTSMTLRNLLTHKFLEARQAIDLLIEQRAEKRLLKILKTCLVLAEHSFLMFFFFTLPLRLRDVWRRLRRASKFDVLQESLDVKTMLNLER